jgi:hypothetical protein
MVIIYSILTLIFLFGLLRIIAKPRKGVWNNFLGLFWVDLIIDFFSEIIDDLD